MAMTNAFIGKPAKPTNAELIATLGPCKAVWDKLVTTLANENDVNIQEWTSYSAKAGWSLRLKQKKRNIVYLIPSRGSFRVAFALGDKAMKAARASRLPKHVMAVLDSAPRYPEGTAVRLEIKGPKDLDVVKKLAAIKLEN